MWFDLIGNYACAAERVLMLDAGRDLDIWVGLIGNHACAAERVLMLDAGRNYS